MFLQTNMADSQLLVLGLEGVGKTLFLKRLQTFSAHMNQPQFSQKSQELTEAPATIPTVGVNLVSVSFGKRKYNFRELGGAMAPIWSNYYKDASYIVYIFDVANRFQVSASCIQLLEVLSSKQTQSKPILLLFNKTDFTHRLKIVEICSIIRLDDIIASAKQDITVMNTSFRNGAGIDGVISWLQEKCSPQLK